VSTARSFLLSGDDWAALTGHSGRAHAEYQRGIGAVVAGQWRGIVRYCGVPTRSQREVLTGFPRGYWVLKEFLGTTQEGTEGAYKRALGVLSGYSRVLYWALSAEYSRDASGTQRALERHSPAAQRGCSNGCSERYSEAYSEGTQAILRGLLRLCGTLDHSRVYTHARFFALSALVVSNKTPFGSAKSAQSAHPHA
jgi:hypothetical protein